MLEWLACISFHESLAGGERMLGRAYPGARDIINLMRARPAAF